MKVYKCGITVTIKLTNIKGIISATTIRFNAVAYEISYFHDGQHKECWLNETQFETTEQKTNHIGFIKN